MRARRRTGPRSLIRTGRCLHFADLSPYTYKDRDIRETDDGWITYRPRYKRLNIGWIDAPHDFIKGPTPSWFTDALLDIIAGPRTNSMRGFHQCTLPKTWCWRGVR